MAANLADDVLIEVKTPPASDSEDSENSEDEVDAISDAEVERIRQLPATQRTLQDECALYDHQNRLQVSSPFMY